MLCKKTPPLKWAEAPMLMLLKLRPPANLQSELAGFGERTHRRSAGQDFLHADIVHHVLHVDGRRKSAEVQVPRRSRRS